MSFDALERSNYDGMPTYLYEFTLGENTWRYASGEQDVSLNIYELHSGVLTPVTAVFSAVNISDSGIVQSGDVQNDDYTVTLPAASAFTTLFLATPPSEGTYLKVRKKNRGDTEAPIVWVGTVMSTKRVSQVAVDVVCKAITASLNRNGLRLSFGRGCPLALYDRNCRADPSAFALAVQVQSTTGASFTSSALSLLPAGYLDGGYFEFPLIAGVMERRAIETLSGTSISVLGTTDGMAVGDWVTVYPGCDRVTLTCQSKFNNLANYGGFPHLPTKSPFDGDPVF